MAIPSRRSFVALAGITVLVGAVVAFVAWEFRHSLFRTSPLPVQVTGQAVRDERAGIIRCTLRMTGSKTPHRITEIQLPRPLAFAVGASPPKGFVEQPHVIGPELSDQAFVDNFNRRTVRWLGEVTLPPDQDVGIAIPAPRPRAGTGTLTFQYEGRDRNDAPTKAWLRLPLGNGTLEL